MKEESTYYRKTKEKKKVKKVLGYLSKNYLPLKIDKLDGYFIGIDQSTLFKVNYMVKKKSKKYHEYLNIQFMPQGTQLPKSLQKIIEGKGFTKLH